MSMFRRVVAVNTALMVAAALVLALSPATISPHVTTEEWIVLGCATAVVVVANMVILRRVFEPLGRLERAMRDVDPNAPGRRVSIAHRGMHEVGQVTVAFNDVLERLERERAESGRRVMLAQESERMRVARELHDEVGQLLTGVVLQMDGLTRRVPATLYDEVVEIREAAREGGDAVREIALRTALITLATGFAERTGVPVHDDLDVALPALSPEAELAIYRVAQEGLTNAARHGQPTVVTLDLHRRDHTLVLRVRDDGHGITKSATTNPGVGLAGMRERALLVGAHLHVEGARGRGTTIQLELPLP
jgi:two-component system, NarL family, sensor histidine kinase UhpB